MEWAYRYETTLQQGEPLKGWVMAPSAGVATRLLERAGQAHHRIRRDSLATLSVWLRRFAPWRQLGVFYRTVASSRARTGAPMSDVLQRAATFLSHPRMTDSIVRFRIAVQNGESLGGAMVQARLPAAHAAAVRAAGEKGVEVETLLELAKEAKRQDELSNQLARIIFMPALVVALAICVIYWVMMYVGPKVLGPLINLNAQLGIKHEFSWKAQRVLDIVGWFTSNPTMATMIYFGSIGLVVLVAIKSQRVHEWIGKIHWVRVVRERSDMAIQWRLYAILRAAGSVPERACWLLAAASSLPEARVWFSRMANYLRAGEADSAASGKAGFPTYVVNALRAAESRGNIAETMGEFCGDWQEDVALASVQLSGWVNVIALAIATLAIVLAGYIVMGPRMELLFSAA